MSTKTTKMKIAWLLAADDKITAVAQRKQQNKSIKR